MSFLAPAFLSLLALAVPIVLLFFLRRRRDPVEVSTTFLWEEAVREERVSPLLNRLERNLLLVLQLAALLLVVAAAADLTLYFAASGGSRRVALLVDRSASMAADAGGGARRIDRARERGLVLLDTLRGGDRAMLVAFDSEARLLSGLTDDIPALRAALRSVEPTDLGTNPRAGLLAVSAAGGAEAELFLFSDGAFPGPPDLPPDLRATAVHFVATGGDGANAGIVDLEVATGLDLPPRAFVSLANAGGDPAPRTVSLVRDGAVFAAREVLLPPRSPAGVSFDLAGLAPGPVEVRLEPGDALPADDRAFFVLREDPVRRILVVTLGNPVLERLRDLHPRVEAYLTSPEAFDVETAATFDLLVYDRVTPAPPLPSRPALFIDCAPPGRGVGLGPPAENPEVVDFDRSRPVNRDVDYTDVLFARASPVVAERPGLLLPLLESSAGPLAAEIAGEPWAVVLGFRLADTNLTLRVAWPILLANILDRAGNAESARAAACARTGSVLLAAPPPGVDSATITGPAGISADLRTLPDGTVAFGETACSGFYRFAFGDGSQRLAAASLLSAAESTTPPADRVLLGGETRPSDPRSVEASRAARPWLLLLALLVLGAEWVLHSLRRRR